MLKTTEKLFKEFKEAQKKLQRHLKKINKGECKCVKKPWKKEIVCFAVCKDEYDEIFTFCLKCGGMSD